tara:strand:- start:3242 stop:4840 length:1599 start_codon:yes stop_codon:yes gene_type:complete
MVFTGNIESDFLKLVEVKDSKRNNLINYAATDFLSLRDSLLDYIKAVYPLDYNNFTESDAGIMLLELVAYMGSVMSFKADYLANENFLSTSRSRNSVQKLLELIGVRMRGPISAAANAKVTIDSPSWADGYPMDITLPIASRAVSVNSPEDGSPITYTLYKVVNGQVDSANSTGSLVLNTETEADNSAGTLYTNLVLQEGALVSESGTFSTGDLVKTVPLNQSPVVEGSVDVFVNGTSETSGVYSEVNNLYFASGGDAKVFQLVSTDDFAATVVFGDNKLGISPNPGDTFLVTYRVGGGSRGNIASEVINTGVSVEASSGNVTGTLENSSQGTGGADAETVQHAKRYAPLTFRRQDRVVTLGDYESFANDFYSSFGSVGKATAATRRAYNSANIIDIYVLEKASDFQLRKASPTFKVELLESIEPKKMLTTEVVVVDGLIRTLDLNITVRIDKELAPQEESIKLKVSDIVRNHFSFSNSEFGKSFIASELNRDIFEIDDVRYATVDNVDSKISVHFNEIIQLNNLTLNVEKV